MSDDVGHMSSISGDAKTEENSQTLPFVDDCLSVVVNTCPRQSRHITEDITCQSQISVARDDAIADDAIGMNVSPNRSVSDDMKRMLADGEK